MINGQAITVRSYQPILDKAKKTVGKEVTGKSAFADVLKNELGNSKVKFSGHAQNRIASRKIDLDSSKVERLNKAVEKAKEKGANETLVLLDDVAMVVSVKNDTVITVMDGENLKENVFTNIDSAVIA